MPVNSEFPDLGFKRLSGYAQFRRGAGGTRDQALSLVQCIFDHRPLAFRKIYDQGHGQRSRIGGRPTRREPAWIDTKYLPFAKHDGAFDDVLQFPNVTGPVIPLEQIQSVLAHTSNSLTGLLGVAVH